MPLLLRVVKCNEHECAVFLIPSLIPHPIFFSIFFSGSQLVNGTITHTQTIKSVVFTVRCNFSLLNFITKFRLTKTHFRNYLVASMLKWNFLCHFFCRSTHTNFWESGADSVFWALLRLGNNRAKKKKRIFRAIVVVGYHKGYKSATIVGVGLNRNKCQSFRREFCSMSMILFLFCIDW